MMKRFEAASRYLRDKFGEPKVDSPEQLKQALGKKIKKIQEIIGRMSDADKGAMLEARGPRFRHAMAEQLPPGFFEDGHLKEVLLAKARAYQELDAVFTVVETYAALDATFISSRLGIAWNKFYHEYPQCRLEELPRLLGAVLAASDDGGAFR